MMRRYNLNKDSRGQFHDPIRFRTETADTLFTKLKKDFPIVLREEGIPFTIEEIEVKTGGLFGSVCRGLLVSYPNPPSKFFDLAFVIFDDGSIGFHVFGESTHEKRKNMEEYYRKNGNLVKAAFCKPDLALLAREHNWQAAVWSAFESQLV